MSEPMLTTSTESAFGISRPLPNAETEPHGRPVGEIMRAALGGSQTLTTVGAYVPICVHSQLPKSSLGRVRKGPKFS
jgi:hypothetical protein